jgi:hypothetical protein
MSKINIEIEKTMNLLDDIEKISPDPLFYIDLLNKIGTHQLERRSSKTFFYGNYKNILFAILIIINLFTVSYFYSIARNSLKEEKLKSTAQIYHFDQSDYNLLTFNK